MSKNKAPPHSLQLLLRSLKKLERSPIWQQHPEILAKLRARLPQCTLEQLERLQAMLKTPLPSFVEQWSWPNPALEEDPEPSTAEEGRKVTETKASERDRGRGQPVIGFPHLEDALAALGEKEKQEPSLQHYPKKQVAFVMKFLHDHGDEVKDDQAKTIGRRIAKWRKDQNPQ
jgi:hypothetical protein